MKYKRNLCQAADPKNDFVYNPLTGEIKRVHNNQYKVSDSGYYVIKVGKVTMPQHRLAWFLYYGKWPKYQIDHINGIKTDNRIANLRDITRSENLQNQSKHRNGRLCGVYFHKSGKKWVARAPKYFNGKKNDKKHYLGCFSSEIEAHKAVLKYFQSIQQKLPQVEKERTNMNEAQKQEILDLLAQASALIQMAGGKIVTNITDPATAAPMPPCDPCPPAPPAA